MIFFKQIMSCAGIGCDLFKQGARRLCGRCFKGKTGKKVCKILTCEYFKSGCRTFCKVHWPMCTMAECHKSIWTNKLCFEHSDKGTLPCTVCKVDCCLKYQQRCPKHVVFCVAPDCLVITKYKGEECCKTHDKCFVCQRRYAKWMDVCRICQTLLVLMRSQLNKDLRKLILLKYL